MDEQPEKVVGAVEQRGAVGELLDGLVGNEAPGFDGVDQRVGEAIAGRGEISASEMIDARGRG